MLGMKPGHVPLERAMSKLGIASRSQAHKLILERRVRVNGTLRIDPDFPVKPEHVKILIDDDAVEKADARTFLLYKPRGVITTRSDEKGRPTVFSLLDEEGLHLIAVGRLDAATSGLLLLTNDTRLAANLTDPRNQVLRTYLVSVRGEVTEAKLETLRRGIVDNDELLRPERIVLRKASGKESHLTLELTEGKNREIRRMTLALGHEVTRLKRVAFGGLELGALQPGQYRELRIAELRMLENALK